MAKVKTAEPQAPLKLDLGCGKNKQPGFIGVDSIRFDGVDQVVDLTRKWPWKNDSVDEIHCSHFIEHLEWPERIHFFNEAFRVMKVGAKMALILPHWASSRYYGDPTHKAPFSEFAFYYLKQEWRDVQAPHTDIKFNPEGYKCNFDATWGYSLHPALGVRNQEFQQNAVQWYKEAAQDIISTLVKI